MSKSEDRIFVVQPSQERDGAIISGPFSSFNGWLNAVYGCPLEQIAPEHRPVFVDYVPAHYPQVAIIRGSIVVPKPVKTVTEWEL